MPIVAGIGAVNVDGRQLTVESSCNVMPENEMKESVVGATGRAGVKVTPITPWVEVAVIMTPDFFFSDFNPDDGVVQVDLRSGRHFTLKDANRVGEPEAAGVDGTTTLRFEGSTCDEY